MATAIRQTVQKRFGDAIWTSFAEAYQKADDYYEEDKLAECLEQCNAILSEGSVPRYIKIITLILLALVVDGEAAFRAARSEAETLYQMTISFHHRGRDEEADQAFDTLREALDELKETEEKEFGVSVDEMEEKDSAALVQAQWQQEEEAATRKLEEGEDADSEALREADAMAMDPANHPAERIPKINMPEAASAPFKPVLVTQQQHFAEPSSPLRRQAPSSNLRQQASSPSLRHQASSSNLHQQASSSNLRQQASSSNLRQQASSSSLRKQASTSSLRPSADLYVPPHLRKAKDPGSEQNWRK